MAIPFAGMTRLAKSDTDLLVARAPPTPNAPPLAVVFTNFREDLYSCELDRCCGTHGFARNDVFNKLNDRYRDVHAARKAATGQQSPAGRRTPVGTPTTGSPRVSQVHSGPPGSLPPYPQRSSHGGPPSQGPNGPRLSGLKPTPQGPRPASTPPGSPEVGAFLRRRSSCVLLTA